MQKLGTLTERLRKRQEQENETIKGLMAEQRRDLLAWSKATLKRELESIESDIRRRTSGLAWRALRNRILWPMLTGVAILVALCAGSWGVMRWMSAEIRSSLTQIQTLEARIEELHQAGGSLQLNRCGPQRRLCVRIDETSGRYQGGYRVVDGY